MSIKLDTVRMVILLGHTVTDSNGVRGFVPVLGWKRDEWNALRKASGQRTAYDDVQWMKWVVGYIVQSGIADLRVALLRTKGKKYSETWVKVLESGGFDLRYDTWELLCEMNDDVSADSVVELYGSRGGGDAVKLVELFEEVRQNALAAAGLKREESKGDQR